MKTTTLQLETKFPENFKMVGRRCVGSKLKYVKIFCKMILILISSDYNIKMFQYVIEEGKCHL